MSVPQCESKLDGVLCIRDLGHPGEHVGELTNGSLAIWMRQYQVADDRANKAVGEVVAELFSAIKDHRPLNGPHEGWAVIKDELDELWEHVRADSGRGEDARHEAAQTAAMALRYMIDVATTGGEA